DERVLLVDNRDQLGCTNLNTVRVNRRPCDRSIPLRITPDEGKRTIVTSHTGDRCDSSLGACAGEARVYERVALTKRRSRHQRALDSDRRRLCRNDSVLWSVHDRWTGRGETDRVIAKAEEASDARADDAVDGI